MNKDLTVGKPSKVLWMFCLPLFASMLFQQLYNIADSLIAGKFIGGDALAAVGNGYEITLVFIAFAFGINIGCSVVVSRLFGEKKFNNLKSAIYTSFIISAVLCVVLVVLGIVVLEPVLKAMNTPNDLMKDCLAYTRIYILGFPFVLFYYVANGIFSALGDSKTPLIFLACSSLANIGVDVLFVKTFNMGVPGVGWATFICQGISCILAIVFVLLRFKKLPSEGKIKAFDFNLFKEIVLIAVPSTLQQIFISVGNIMIQGALNPFGKNVMAGYGAAIKLNNLVIASIVTVANGISNYTAQNLGAGKPERIKKGFGAGIVMVLIICLPLVLTYVFAGEYLIKFFIKDWNNEQVYTGARILKILAPFYFIVSSKLVADGFLRGSKCMVRFMIATLVDLVIRVSLAYILKGTALGSDGIWISFPIGWIIAFAISICFFFFNKTLHPKQIKTNENVEA